MTISSKSCSQTFRVSSLLRSTSDTVPGAEDRTSKAVLRAKPCCPSGPKSANCGKQTGIPPLPCTEPSLGP